VEENKTKAQIFDETSSFGEPTKKKEKRGGGPLISNN